MDQALFGLRDLIAAGDYAPGDRLPPERELTGRLGVTRSVLRKALETLEREGAIWRHVGRGTFVSAGSRGAPVASPRELARDLSPLHMMRARQSLEPAIAREAAINADPAGIARIAETHAAATAAASWDDYETLDDVLHRAIAQATGNALLLALFDKLNQVRRAVAWDTVVRSSPRPAPDHDSFAEHARIVEAIRMRNGAEAQTAMRRHLASVSDRLFGDH